MSNNPPRLGAATGHQNPSSPVQNPDDRVTAAARQAMDGLRQIRAVMNPPDGRPVSVPAAWERLQPVRAVTVVLEEAGFPAATLGADGRPTTTGYRIRRDDGVVRVEWIGPPGSGATYQQHDQLQRCARALQDLGWETLEYRGPRGHRWLEVEAAP